MEHFGSLVALIGIVVVVASLLSGVIERTRVPIVAVFLGLGALVGPMVLGLISIGLASPALNVLATLGLAMVLFQDALTNEKAELRRHHALIWRLIGPGTLIPAALMAVAARALLDLPWPAAAILGAALASTDPVLLRSVLRAEAMPRGPRVALRIETGMNDVVLLPIVVIAMLAYHAGPAGPSLRSVADSLIGLLVLGPVAGAAVGWVGISLLVWVRSRTGVRRDYESLYAIGLAFTAYATAEALGGSGFLAAFAAGLVIALKDVELCDCFREYGEATAEMLLLLTFVALGTTLIWRGLTVINGPTLAFAAVALLSRTAALFPVLARAGVSERDRRIIALFGPRGLSSLLLTLLPVFAGIQGAERLFEIACLVVLLSVVLHGGGIALFLHGKARKAEVTGLTEVTEGPPAEVVPEKISIDELKRLREAGEQVIIVDARAERSFRSSDLMAAGAVRLDPDNAVRDAREKRLSQRATLVVYCA